VQPTGVAVLGVALPDRVDVPPAEPVVDLDGADLLEQRRQPEDRHRQEEEAEERCGVVADAVLLHRAVDADDDRDDEREDDGDQDHPHGHGQP
jgi:hypothetical protein